MNKVIILSLLLLGACKVEEKRETVEERIERESRAYCDKDETYFPAQFSRWEACIQTQYFGEFISAGFAGRSPDMPDSAFRNINTGRFSNE